MMKRHSPKQRLRSSLILIASMVLPLLPPALHAQVLTNWVAYNDFARGPLPDPGVNDGWGTPNEVTSYDMGFGPGGPLTNYPAGVYSIAELPPGYPLDGQAALIVRPDNATGVFGLPAAGGYPFPGSPAYDLFHGISDMGNLGSMFGVGAGQAVRLTFTNLNPAMRYKFRGSATRQGAAIGTHDVRWTLNSIEGAVSFVSAHTSDLSAGTNTIYVPGSPVPGLALTNGQVVFQSGFNTNGMTVGWDDIVPSADGTFTVVNQSYNGPFYQLDSSGTTWILTNATGNVGYVLTAIALVEYGLPSSLSWITQPVASVAATQHLFFTLNAEAAGTAPYYQWYKEGVGPIAGANLRSFTLHDITVADSGLYYCVVTNRANAITSIVSQVTVNADIAPPEVAAITGSGNFSQITVTFNERVDLSAAGEASNYEIVGQPGVSAVVITNAGTETGGTTVVLTTPLLDENTTYELKVGLISDLAGNFVDPNRVYPFKTWVLSPANGVLFEAYSPVGGPNTIDSLTNQLVSPNYPSNPFASMFIGVFDSRAAFPDDSHENYGSRQRGLFIPPTTGLWRFYVRSDDPSQVYINPNGPSPAGMTLILNETACCGDWNKFQSEALALVAGRGYYLEVLQKEGGGGDYAKVAARLDGTGFPVLGTANSAIDPESIAGDAAGYPAAPAGVGGEITITQEPSDITVNQNEFVTFSVGVANPNNLPVFYQWYKNGVAVPDANRSSYTFAAPLEDDGVRFSVQAAIIGSKVLSRDVLLTVNNDSIRPTVVSATADQTLTNIYIRFSELMEPTFTEDALGYAPITGPGSVSAIGGQLLADGMTVQIALGTPLQVDSDYTVAVTLAEDLAGNSVAAGTTVLVHSWKPTPGFVTFQTFNTPVSGTTVDLLTSSTNYPDNPRETFYISSFDTRKAYPTDTHEQFGGRLYGLFIPPTSGNWIFYLRSDDSSELYLNPAGIDAGGKVLITSEPGCCGAFSAHASAPIPLTAGQPVFIEALYKEGGGGDFCQVAAKLETDPTNPDTLGPIPASMLGTIINPAGISLQITEQPTNQVGVLSSPGKVLFSEDLNGSDGGFTVENSPTAPAGPWTYNAAKGTWSANGGDGVVFSKLNSLIMTVTEPGSVVLTFNHRYTFEDDGTTRWDAGQVRISVNGEPYTPVDRTNFTANGYAFPRVIGGNNIMNNQYAFNGTSAGYADGTFIQSIAVLGVFSPGDEIAIQFVGGWDEGTINSAPNWEIDKLVVTEGVVPLYSQDFTATDGGFTVVNTNNPAGPWVYNTARGTWSADGGEPIVASLLSSPDITVSKDGFVVLNFSHRYNFEDGTTLWDGGQVRLSVNGGPYELVPPESFSTNGYAPGLFVGNGFIKGLPGFNGQSADYTNSFIKSITSLGAFQAGDELSVQFAGSWDDGFTMPPAPNWELDGLTLEDGIAVPVTFTVAATGVVPGATVVPIAYQWQKNSGAGFVDILNATGSSLTFFVVEADDGTLYRCIVSVPGASLVSDSALLTIGGEAGPTVSIKRGTGTVTIEWSSGALESAPTVTGPWTPVGGAVSPYIIQTTGSALFYRTSQ